MAADRIATMITRFPSGNALPERMVQGIPRLAVPTIQCAAISGTAALIAFAVGLASSSIVAIAQSILNNASGEKYGSILKSPSTGDILEFTNNTKIGTVAGTVTVNGVAHGTYVQIDKVTGHLDIAGENDGTIVIKDNSGTVTIGNNDDSIVIENNNGTIYINDNGDTIGVMKNKGKVVINDNHKGFVSAAIAVVENFNELEINNNDEDVWISENKGKITIGKTAPNYDYIGIVKNTGNIDVWGNEDELEVKLNEGVVTVNSNQDIIQVGARPSGKVDVLYNDGKIFVGHEDLGIAKAHAKTKTATKPGDVFFGKVK